MSTRLPLLLPLACSLALASFVASGHAQEDVDNAPAPSVQELLDASPPSDWRTPDPEHTLYMELEGGRVVIELAPEFAPAHVANIRTLAREGFWDGLAIYRAQDNFVVQFGDPSEDEGERKPLGSARTALPAEFERTGDGLGFTALPDPDGWSHQAGFVDGFPAARAADGTTWLAHCYGMVGAGRGMEPDSSTGAELYVVIGQAPRQLDRNITVVGRVIDGIGLLSAIPRGPEPMGVYEDAGRHVPIHSVRLASDLPPGARSDIELLRTDSRTFAAVTEARRNRRDDWYHVPAGHIDLCNVPLPGRKANR